MNLYDYLNKNLSRGDPHPVIDFRIRAEKRADGRISFYIHADSRDSDTEDYWVSKNQLNEKRLCDEPLSDRLRNLVLKKTDVRFGAFWGMGNPQVLCVHGSHDHRTVGDWIESVGEGINANYLGTEDDRYILFRPCIGTLRDWRNPYAPLAAMSADSPPADAGREEKK